MTLDLRELSTWFAERDERCEPCGSSAVQTALPSLSSRRANMAALFPQGLAAARRGREKTSRDAGRWGEETCQTAREGEGGSTQLLVCTVASY